MLKQLTVTNFKLVDALDIAFDGGLTVVTGESGAGKSVLLSALAMVLGERASSPLVRAGAPRAQVVAEFDIRDIAGAFECLDSRELADPDHPQRCLLRRVVGSDGRSRAFVNGTPVNLQTLRELAGDLVDIHSQDENQRLVSTDVQLALLDAYGVTPGLRESMTDAYRAWKRTELAARELERKLAGVEDRGRLLRYQLAELDELNLGDGEFDALDAEFRRLSRAEIIRETVARAVQGIEGADELRRVQGDLDGIGDSHRALGRAREALASALELTDDALRDLRGYCDALESNPEHLAEIEQRLNIIQDLARKHRVRPEALAGHRDGLREELGALRASREELEAASEQAATLRAEFERIAAAVSRERRAAAGEFSDAVSACMETLGIGGGRLSIGFGDAESERGLDSAEFLVTTNPKYAPGSLGKVASGGERARISLAIDVVAAERARLPCLVLDEADVGVGGPASDVIGRLLRRLGRRTQVICVTHAPQVAALADAHLLVEKDVEQDISIRSLDDVARIEELARMLAGAGVTEESRAYARTLRQEAGHGTC